MAYYILKNGNGYHIHEEKREKDIEFIEKMLKTCDAVYPISSNVYHIYRIFDKKKGNVPMLLESIFETCDQENMFAKLYDKHSSARIKALAEYSGIHKNEITQFTYNKFLLFFGDSNGDSYGNMYYVVQKEELNKAAFKSIKNMFDTADDSIPVKKADAKKALGYTSEQMKEIWNSKEKGLIPWEISEAEIEKLEQYLITSYPYEKLIGYETNGYYEISGDYYLFPTKNTMKNRLRQQINN